MAKGAKKAKRAKERQERRFVPKPTASLVVVSAVGGVAAGVLGAGSWAQFGGAWSEAANRHHAFAPALLAIGAVAFGAAVWLGTSGEPPVRVGAGGVGVEKAKEVTRIPWYGVERVVWDPDKMVLSVQGHDDTGAEQRLLLTPKAHAHAIGWIVKEARDRIADHVDVPVEALGLPVAGANDGEVLVMDPVQVVGRRCASSDRVIAYEPDARVCPRCERVYYKESVPETCACGSSLASAVVVEASS